MQIQIQLLFNVDPEPPQKNYLLKSFLCLKERKNDCSKVIKFYGAGLNLLARFWWNYKYRYYLFPCIFVLLSVLWIQIHWICLLKSILKKLKHKISPKCHLSLWIVNLYLKSYTFYLHFILYLHVWIRIRIWNTDPESSWIRIQYGSGSTILIIDLDNFRIFLVPEALLRCCVVVVAKP